MKQWKPWEELTIQDNFMFQKVMRNEELCRIFLERVLDISIRTVSFARHTLSLYARLIRLCLDCDAIPSIIAVT
ncbi:MAG: hypothetical protein IJU65_02580, partial [Desulfovibrio sp.]|nr:hypothetical protein [Desulfovibrio sp.]